MKNEVTINWRGPGWYAFSGTSPVVGNYMYPPTMTSGDVTYEESKYSNRGGTCRLWTQADYEKFIQENPR